MTLSGLERNLIDFARLAWPSTAARDSAIRHQFGMSSTAYYQRLNALIDRPEALEYDPIEIGRLRRVRQSKRSRRSGAIR